MADRLPKIPMPKLTLPKVAVPKIVVAPPKPPAGDRSGDPLAAVELTGNFEQDSEAELSETLRLFREKDSKDRSRKELATDSEFWFAAYFKSREQKEAFLQALGLLQDGDKYVDGEQLAAALGIELPPVDLPAGKGRIDPEYAALTR